MNKDEVILAIENLKDRKLRSFLSVLSILIGIASIFALASFGWGLQNYVNSLAEEAGVETFYIQAKGTGAPGSDDTFFLTQDDNDFVEKIKGVKEVVPMYFKPGQVEFRNQIKYGFISGMDPDKQEFIDKTFTVVVEEGRNLKKGETDKVVLGYNYKLDNKVFKRGVRINDKVEVNGEQFEVIGFYEEVGNPQDDSNIYVTPDVVEILFPETKDKYAVIFGMGEKGIDMEGLTDTITKKLRKFKDQEEGKEDFFVLSFVDALETFGSILNIINGSLLLIALISVFVATVNIMNTMYTAVIERTKEIGVMKAVGAQNKDIMFIFVFESGFLGMLGGILGVVFGYLISSTGGKIAANAGYALLSPVFPWYLIVGCIMFGFLVGAGAGVFPALQAAKLKPVDALRYE
ncbi:MAG: ABC transporter permease [Nanoarchaeota archaeon]|nr:ABC transporter permease [Nanoarchaeota archaeon]